MSRKPQNKRKRDTAYHPELHTRDVNSREIFKNDTLASQFLRIIRIFHCLRMFSLKISRMYPANQLYLQQCAGSDKRNLQEDFMDFTNKDECARGRGREMMGEIGGRGMGYLFENMEKMDIQAERRNT